MRLTCFHIRCWLTLALLLGAGTMSICQQGVSVVYAPSKVIKHRSSLLFDVPARSHEFRLAYTFQTGGTHRWERYWGNPKIVLNGIWVDFGNQAVLGSAIGILPELHFTLKKWKKMGLNLQFGTGAARLNKPYDAISNPTNNAIGSYFNNVTSLKLGFTQQWNPQLSTSLSTGLVHFSNGLSSSPNAGINIYGLTFSAMYQLATPDKKPLLQAEEPTLAAIPFRKWLVDVQYHHGFTEFTVPGGPKYNVHALSLGVGYRYTEFMTLYAGGEYEFNDATYTFFRQNFYSEKEATERATSTVVYVSHELRFGPVFNRIRLGFYLPVPIENSRSVYTKVVTGLYLPELKHVGRPYVGVLLKTHTAVADYLGLLVGISI